MKNKNKNSSPIKGTENEAAQNAMAMSAKSIWLLVIGLVVIIIGNLLLVGGGSDDPNVFSYAMFDFRRLYLAPIVIIAGVVVEIVAIMKVFKTKKN